MGKIKEQRFRVHKNVGSKLNIIKNSILETNESTEKEKVPLLLPIISENPFSSINIDINSVTKPKQVSFDTLSLSGKSHREIKKDEQHLPKKEKQKRRHERFLEKLEIRYKKDKKKKPKKKEIDLQPLLVTLPGPSSKPSKPKIPVPRQSMKAKKRLKNDLSDIKHFRKVLDDAVFRKNPAVTIKEFLQQKIAEKRPDLK